MSKRSQNRRRLTDIYTLADRAKYYYAVADYAQLCAACDRVQDLRVAIAQTGIQEDVEEAWKQELGLRTLLVQSMTDNLRDIRRELTQDPTRYPKKDVLANLLTMEQNVEGLVGNGTLMDAIKAETTKIRALL